MKKLSPEKRNQLILVVLLIAVALAALYFILIGPQLKGIQDIAGQKAVMARKLSDVRTAINNADQIESNLTAVRKVLARKEEDIASGDTYSWMVNFIRKFKIGYNVEIPQFNKGPVTDENLLPRFPYKQVSISVSGTAYYHDLGRFIADFENQFPNSRILNLSLEPAGVQGPGDTERLSFKMDIVTLAQPDAS